MYHLSEKAPSAHILRGIIRIPNQNLSRHHKKEMFPRVPKDKDTSSLLRPLLCGTTPRRSLNIFLWHKGYGHLLQ